VESFFSKQIYIIMG